MRTTAEQLWFDPDWTCPNCQAVNFAVRERCRFCGYDSNCGEFPWYDPMPPYEIRFVARCICVALDLVALGLMALMFAVGWRIIR